MGERGIGDAAEHLLVKRCRASDPAIHFGMDDSNGN